MNSKLLNTNLLKKFISVEKEEVVNIFIQAFGNPTYEGDDYWLWYEPEKPLLVAHIDTVCSPQLPIELEEGVWRTHGTADDRAGVYTIFELKKSYPDLSILLTDYEEKGGIGVKNFCSMAKEEGLRFLYAIEYDRKGFEDCIDYNGVNAPDFMKVFEEHYIPAEGTYSDVSTIQLKLNLSAVNLSTGYKNNHSERETLFLEVIERNLRLFPVIRKALGEQQYPTIRAFSL